MFFSDFKKTIFWRYLTDTSKKSSAEV